MSDKISSRYIVSEWLGRIWPDLKNMNLGEKKRGQKKGPSKKMFQGEKCSVCEDPGRFL